MMEPTVTVIIPNYNHAPYLPERIESVLKQTYQRFEILLLDDCSTDNSRELLTQYAAQDERIKLVLNEHNSGSTFKQWNKGIGLASGDYVWIAESDDASDLTFLEKLVQRLEANPQADLAYCQSWRIDANSQEHGTLASTMAAIDESRWTQDFVAPGIDLIKQYMVYCNIIPNASAVLLRRSLLAKVGPADETMLIMNNKLVGLLAIKNNNHENKHRRTSNIQNIN